MPTRTDHGLKRLPIISWGLGSVEAFRTNPWTFIFQGVLNLDPASTERDDA